jgi:multidrug efflux pump subunit AcrA (membrane-fusion protein)
LPRKPGFISLTSAGTLIVGVCVSAAGLVLARNWRLNRQTIDLELALQTGPPVLVTRVHTAPQTCVLEIPGSTVGHDESPIFAKLPGYLKAIYVDKGDRVKRDQLLAVLESAETDKQVAQALADYDLQKVTDARDQTLVKLGVLPQKTADESHAAMLRAQSVLAQLKAMAGYEMIRAPFDGMVTVRNADPGTLIPEATNAAAARPLLIVAKLKPMRVYEQVPQRRCAIYTRRRSGRGHGHRTAAPPVLGQHYTAFQVVDRCHSYDVGRGRSA